MILDQSPGTYAVADTILAVALAAWLVPWLLRVRQAARARQRRDLLRRADRLERLSLRCGRRAAEAMDAMDAEDACFYNELAGLVYRIEYKLRRQAHDL